MQAYLGTAAMPFALVADSVGGPHTSIDQTQGAQFPLSIPDLHSTHIENWLFRADGHLYSGDCPMTEVLNVCILIVKL